MHRRIVRPFGSSIPATRAISMLFALAVLWVLYDNVRQPATWRWLATRNDDENTVTGVQAGPVRDEEPLQETVVPGPNDLDPEAMAEFKSREELITDRTELRPREMIAYWQLMAWARTEPFREFEQRAKREPAFTQLWEQPSVYRAQPIRLRMHVRRVLQYDAPQNPLELKVMYEAWGWTDESKSYPYTVVFAEKPPGLPVGPDVEGEVVFVGYFLKNMAYTAFDKRRAAPLLVGRLRMSGPARVIAPERSVSLEIWSALVLGGLAVAVAVWLFFAVIRRRRLVVGVAPEGSDFQWPMPDMATSATTFEFDPLTSSVPSGDSPKRTIEVDP